MTGHSHLYRCVGCGWEYRSDRIFLSSVEHACPARNGRVTLLKLVTATSNHPPKEKP